MRDVSKPVIPEAHVDLRHLMRMEQGGVSFSLLPRQPARSALVGQHASKLRGRGLNFLELRAYQPGDDTRTIDWKVTARMRKPYTRVFTEERERPALLVVDQRQSMFFGSRYNMKSGTAAEIAALATWRVLAAKDRVGAIVFNDSDLIVVRPERSRGTAIRILKAIVEMNQKLNWTLPRMNPAMLNTALRRARELTTHDYLVLQITDGAGRDEQTRRLNTDTGQHNDLVMAYVFDPLEHELPTSRRALFVSGGHKQLQLPTDRHAKHRFREEIETAVDDVRRSWASRQVPVLPISAAEATAPQLRRLLTVGRPAGERR